MLDTLALKPSSHDLEVDELGNWATVGDATPGSGTGAGRRLAQDVATRCSTWRGEMYFDTTQGIAWERILSAAPEMQVVSSALMQEALKVPLCATALPDLQFDAALARRVHGTLAVSDYTGNLVVIDIPNI